VSQANSRQRLGLRHPLWRFGSGITMSARVRMKRYVFLWTFSNRHKKAARNQPGGFQ
jgi:hypothetical protein